MPGFWGRSRWLGCRREEGGAGFAPDGWGAGGERQEVQQEEIQMAPSSFFFAPLPASS